MCFGGGGGDGGASQARADEQARQARIKSGIVGVDKQFAQFDDPFFKSREKAYTAYAAPQLNDQYKQNRDQLAFSLARRGLDQSSEAARQGGVLQRDYALGQQQVADAAIGEAQKARQSVEDNRNNLINQLQATADPQLAANNALREASVLSMRPGFSPLGNLFQNTTALLGSAQQAGYYSGGPGIQPFKNAVGMTSKPKVVS